MLPKLRGAFCFMFMDEDTLYAARDPQASVRWYSAGWSAAGWWPRRPPHWTSSARPSSAKSSRANSSPIDENGLRSQRFAKAVPGCVFEYVYLARPDTTINGRSIHAARVEMGRSSRRISGRGRSGDPLPESGTPAAIGYAEASGIPYGQGLVKNAYVGRTFIQPSQTIRQLGIRLKLNPLRESCR